MRGKIVKFSLTCKINSALSKNLQIFFIFCLLSFESNQENLA